MSWGGPGPRGAAEGTLEQGRNLALILRGTSPWPVERSEAVMVAPAGLPLPIARTFDDILARECPADSPMLVLTAGGLGDLAADGVRFRVKPRSRATSLEAKTLDALWVPEPATLVLIALGLGGCLAARRLSRDGGRRRDVLR
jgi:hypothetical protein